MRVRVRVRVRERVRVSADAVLVHDVADEAEHGDPAVLELRLAQPADRELGARVRVRVTARVRVR